MDYRWNEYQTPFEELHLERYPDEVQEQFHDFMATVPYLQWLASADRPRAKDLPRDDKGRIIVDIAHPHILEDMDYFRPAVLHYQQTGRYCDYTPNANPNSPFMKWFIEETRRCWYGYVRESDGEWIPGDFYFFLNYCPMPVTEEGTGAKKKRAKRVISFPSVWEGHYLRYHYLEQARENAHHAAELASRGKGKSSTGAEMLAKRFILGEDEEVSQRVISYITASEKKYLVANGDQTLDKFEFIINFIAQRTELQWPKQRITSTLQNMQWQMGYRDVSSGVKMGTQNSVIGVSSKDDESKLRGSRGVLYIFEEFGSFPRLRELYSNVRFSVEEGELVYGMLFSYGTAGDAESDFQAAQEMTYNPRGFNLQPVPNIYDKAGQGRKEFVYFFPGYVNRAGCYNHDGVSDVPKALLEILMDRYITRHNSTSLTVITRRVAEYPITPQEAMLKTAKNMFPVSELNERLNQLLSDPHAMDGVFNCTLVMDSTGNVSPVPVTDEPITEFPLQDNKAHGCLQIFNMPERNSEGKVFSERYIMGCLTPGEKVLTDSGLKNVEDVTFQDKLVSVDGDYVSIKELQKYEVSEEDTYRIHLWGILDGTTFTKEHPILSCRPKLHYYSIGRVNREGLPYKYRTYDFSFRKAEEIHKDDYVKVPNIYSKMEAIPYEMWDDSEIRIDRQIPNPLDKEDFWWYMGLILGDGWASNNGYTVNVSFNSKEQEYIDKYLRISREIFNRTPTLVRDRGTCKEYQISSQQLNRFITKTFKRGAENKALPEWVKFLPKKLKVALIMGYLASDGCVSGQSMEFVSISRKLVNDFQDLFASLEIASSVTILRGERKGCIIGKEIHQKKAYHLRVFGNYVKKFISMSYIDYKLSKFNSSKQYSNHDTLRWIFTDDGYIYIKVKGVEKGSFTGTVFNFHCETSTFMCNYIPTHNCDPVDSDEAETLSLYSFFVLDLWTDTIVAEYTGRLDFADDCHELLRKTCLLYNAKVLYESNLKGNFAYFQRMQCTHLLADTPEYLKDKDIIKTIGIGNKAHPYSQIVRTPDGIRKWGDIKIGDTLFGSNGTICRVTDIPFDDETDIYEIELRDGRRVRASENHLWNVIDYAGIERVVSTKFLLEKGFRKKGKYTESMYYIPQRGLVHYKDQPILIEPYFMGLMLGDGCFVHSRHHKCYFTSKEEDFQEYNKILNLSYRRVDDRHWIIEYKDFGNKINEYGLVDSKSHTKFIPDAYKYNTEKVRLEVLRGLLDTDGWVDYGGNPAYCSVSKQLALDVLEIARSLGITCNIHIRENKYGKVYKVLFYTDRRLFNLKRKYSKQRVTKARAYKIGIKSIKYIGRERAKCVTVDSPDSCYLIGDFVVTHNSKGVNATAAVNNYANMLIRDWLIKPVHIVEEDENGEVHERSISNLYRLKNIALIRELIAFNPEINVDRVRALGMAMLYREEKMILYGGNPQSAKQEIEADYLGNDPFFTQNYDERFKIEEPIPYMSNKEVINRLNEKI